jgi:hypothetical protein
MDDNATNEALAAMGTSVANVDAYESSVIREATLKTAPTLSGVGFPDLSSLGPYFDHRKNKIVGSADTPHVQTLLSRTRTELAGIEPESHRSLVLQMKEQVLLTYLQKISGLPPEPGQQNQFPARIKKKAKILKDDGRVARSVTSASATASFGKQALLERKKERGKRRTTMMQLKQHQQSQVVNEDDEELKEMLRQRRKERQERRRRRAEQWAEDEEEVEKYDDEELTFDDDDSADKIQKDAVKNEESVRQEAAYSDLTCPICKDVLTVNAGSTQEESDTFLAQHVEACQQGGRRTRRGGQSGASYDDITTRQALAAKRQTEREKKESQKLRPQSRSVKPAVDDMQIADYEDRVDDWIESGLERMKHMEERDETEVPPGAVTYDGGLVIPAWMNNRLFPYQRTGLRWMWELHMQEAGGVVGDGKCGAN